MTGVYVFLGPTLPAADARAELDAQYLPPVSAGDVCRVGELRPRAIGIVDGCGQGGQAVWHKEILWVMERGVHVFGAAAIGALRAAELASFGMRGTGWVYRAVSDGTLERDDEIAVAWESSQDGYLKRSEAMVSIRRTLQAARDDGIIGAATHDVLVATGAAMFYPSRTWPALLAAARAPAARAPAARAPAARAPAARAPAARAPAARAPAARAPAARAPAARAPAARAPAARAPAARADLADPAELDALRRWLPAGRVDQQADDALAMLHEMGTFLATGPQPQRVAWTTAPTTRWDTLYRYAASRPDR